MAGLFLVDKRLGEEKRPRGAMIAAFFAFYFTGRFFVEFYKEYEGPLEAGSALTMGQVLSIPGIIIGWGGLYLAMKKKLPAAWPKADEADEDEPPKQKKKSKKKSKKTVAAKDDEDDRREDDEDETTRDERDDDERDDDERDDDERDDDQTDRDEEDDDGESAPEREAPERDADVDEEFDDKGALKRRRD
jgi:hypothetical protein